MTATAFPDPYTAALITAGGQGSRLGGLDKGLQPFHGRPLIDRIIERIRPQTGSILLCANRNHEAYRRRAANVFADLPEFAGCGPLAALASAAVRPETARFRRILFLPCDTPDLPDNLLAVLHHTARHTGAEAVYAATAEQKHYNILLLDTALLAGTAGYLRSGGRSIRGWLGSLNHAEALFEDERRFANCNTPEDFRPS